MDTCSKCGAPFNQLPWQIRKHDHRCHSCVSSDIRDYRERRAAAGWPIRGGRNIPENKRKYSAEYASRPEVKKRNAERMRLANQNPEQKLKQAARRMVRTAVSAGRLIQMCCAICGVSRTEAHHYDYAMPLDVLWLCPQHHANVHGRGIYAAAATGGDA